MKDKVKKKGERVLTEAGKSAVNSLMRKCIGGGMGTALIVEK